MPTATIFDIKEFAVHDGPGIRCTVFLKGCPLRCLWCHNPEGLSPKPQAMLSETGCTHCGRCLLPCEHPECQGLGRCVHACPRGLVRLAGQRMEAADVAQRLLSLAPMLVDGGATISGGEPLMQPEFVLDLIQRLQGMHTIVETSGYADPAVFRAVARAVDLLYLDIKHADSEVHQKLTGVPNEKILANLAWLKESGAPFLIRVPLIPGLNDDRENLEATAALLEGAKALQGVELLPYNPYAGAKYKGLGMAYPLKNFQVDQKFDIPKEAFESRGIPWRLA